MHLQDEYAPLQKQGAFHPSKGIAEKYPPHGRRTMANRAITLCYEKSNEDIAFTPTAWYFSRVQHGLGRQVSVVKFGFGDPVAVFSFIRQRAP